jgi:hypothetical protein
MSRRRLLLDSGGAALAVGGLAAGCSTSPSPVTATLARKPLVHKNVKDYLEPETRQFHIQYFDPDDNPVPTTGCLVIQQRLPGGRPISLVTQHLGPGHYYAATGARNGRYLYVFTATASAFGPGGGDPGQIAAPITIYVH